MIGISALGTVLLSTGAGFGLASAVGVALNPLSPILPIMLLGIGVDDAFVLVNVYKGLPSQLSISSKVEKTLEKGGLAVLMTSLTDIAAFAAGSLSDLGAIKSFCQLATICIALDLLLQITLFMSLVAWDRLRAEQGRLWYCCCKTSAGVPPKEINEGDVTPAAEKLSKYVAKPLLYNGWKPKLFILLVISGLVGTMTWAFVDRITVGQTAADTAPFDSYLPPAVNVIDQHFPEAGGSPVEIMFTNTADLDTIEVQDGMLQVLAALEATNDINKAWGPRGGTMCVLEEFVIWTATNFGDCSAASQTDARTTDMLGSGKCFEKFISDAQNNYNTRIQGLYSVFCLNRAPPKCTNGRTCPAL